MADDDGAADGLQAAQITCLHDTYKNPSTNDGSFERCGILIGVAQTSQKIPKSVSLFLLVSIVCGGRWFTARFVVFGKGSMLDCVFFLIDVPHRLMTTLQMIEIAVRARFVLKIKKKTVIIAI